TAAVFWGVAGTVAQFLLSKSFTVEWLVSMRLSVSGIVLLTFLRMTRGKQIFAIWRKKEDVIRLLLFSLVGMLGVQYTFFAAIFHSNAATATVLQYLAPTMIVVYVALRMKRLPNRQEVIAIILALTGTVLLVTKGQLGTLSISSWALFWGIASAITLAFYTLQPYKLIAKWGAITVIGWSMFIGGAVFTSIYPPSFQSIEWSTINIISVLFIVFFGTLIAFYFYLESLTFISPSEASLLACVEPLSAAVLAVVWLQVTFTMAEWIGAFCI